MTRPQHFHAPNLDTRQITLDWLTALCALGASYLGSATWQAAPEDERRAREWLRARGIETEGCAAPDPGESLALVWGGRMLEG